MTKLAMEGGPPVRPRDDFLVFGRPVIEKEEIDAVMDCYKRGWIGTGPRVQEFEKDFAVYNGARHAIALNSCTAALHLSMLAAGIGAGDEVITSPMTFCATVNAIIHSGARPVLADCGRESMNLSPEAVAAKITPRTKAILPVHFAGRCCDMESLTDLASAHNLVLIEDCAHAIESDYRGTRAGRFGKLGCFSFYVTKNVITGEGGMVTTDDARLAAKIKTLALHGMDHDAWKRYSDDGYKHYQVVHAGFKYNMMDIQAAAGIHQLKRVEANWAKRQRVWDIYNESFKDLPCILPKKPEPDIRHAYHLYTPLIEIDRIRGNRDWVLNAMNAENIGTGVHYLPVHLHPYYQQSFGWKPGDFPNAEWIGTRTLSLPLSPGLSEKDIADVRVAFCKVLKSKAG